jgi:hypothetical protein
MDYKQYPTSVRLSESEKEYLTKVAHENALLKSNGKASLGLAVKHLIREKIANEHNHNKINLDDKVMHLVSMIEQINVIIPHLFYNSRFGARVLNTILKANSKSDNEIMELLSEVLESTKNACGQIQKNEYETLYPSSDNRNMKTIPIEKERNQWK